MKKSRAQKAGEDLGHAIIEMIHLMYQKKTALTFLRSLWVTLDMEYARRKEG